MSFCLYVLFIPLIISKVLVMLRVVDTIIAYIWGNICITMKFTKVQNVYLCTFHFILIRSYQEYKYLQLYYTTPNKVIICCMIIIIIFCLKYTMDKGTVNIIKYLVYIDSCHFIQFECWSFEIVRARNKVFFIFFLSPVSFTLLL